MDRLVFGVLAVFAVSFLAVPVRADSDETTAAYLAGCRTDFNQCKNSVGLAVVLGGYGCPPDTMAMPTADQTQEVLSWMETHPQVHPEDWDEAMNAAFEALYPCSN